MLKLFLYFCQYKRETIYMRQDHDLISYNSCDPVAVIGNLWAFSDFQHIPPELFI